MKALLAHDWQCNVRELENTMERVVVLCQGPTITPDLLVPPGRPNLRWRTAKSRGNDVAGLIEQLVRTGIQTLPDDGKLHERLVGGVERELIEQVLQQCDRVQVKAAAKLGINRNTLHQKVSKYGEPDTDAKKPPPGEEGAA
jgi:DNA-binding NtrC family response regulator